jgi:hypothetical protein
LSALVYDKSTGAWQEPEEVPKAYSDKDGAYCDTVGYGHNGNEWEEVWSPGRLPGGLQEVSYLESTGTQYIDTGINPSLNDVITSEVATPEYYYTNTDNGIAFGASDASVKQILLLYNNTNGYISFRYGYYHQVKSYEVNFSCTDRLFHECIFDYPAKKVYFDGEAKNMETTAYTPTTPSFYLFGTHYLDRNNLYNPTIIRKFSIVRNSELIIDLVPCYRKSDKVAGMYDMITGKLFTNDGTGTFIVGEKV